MSIINQSPIFKALSRIRIYEMLPVVRITNVINITNIKKNSIKVIQNNSYYTDRKEFCKNIFCFLYGITRSKQFCLCKPDKNEYNFIKDKSVFCPKK